MILFDQPAQSDDSLLHRLVRREFLLFQADTASVLLHMSLKNLRFFRSSGVDYRIIVSQFFVEKLKDFIMPLIKRLVNLLKNRTIGCNCLIPVQQNLHLIVITGVGQMICVFHNFLHQLKSASQEGMKSWKPFPSGQGFLFPFLLCFTGSYRSSSSSFLFKSSAVLSE